MRFESTGSYTGVGGVDFNYGTHEGIGSYQLYLKVDKKTSDGTFRLTKDVGDDPAFYPYCYELGSKVRLYRVNQDMPRYPESWKPAWLDWKGLPSRNRDWTNTEEDNFITRLGGRTLEQDMKLAGIDLQKAQFLVTEIKVSYGTFK